MAPVVASLATSPESAAQELTLTESVERALRDHPSLGASRARMVAANEATSAARAALLPGVSLNASLTRFEEPMIVSPLHRLDLMNPPAFDETLVQGQAGLAYTLFDAGGRSSRIEAASAFAEGSRFGVEATEMSLIEQVAQAYAGTLSARAVAEAAAAQVASVEQEVARAQRSLEAGTIAEVGLLRARAALQDARARQASAEARVGLSERSLERLIGVARGTIAGRTLVELELVTPAAQPAEGRSPLVEQADRAVEAAEARTREQRSTRLPTLQLGAALLDFGTLDGDHVFEWQAGVQLSWSVFNGGARSAAIRRADADLRAARGDLAVAELQAANATDVARTAIAEADARVEALGAAVEQWTEVARIEALALEAGSGVQNDLLRAEASLFEARAGHARAGYDAVLARVALAHATGELTMEWLNRALEIGR